MRFILISSVMLCLSPLAAPAQTDLTPVPAPTTTPVAAATPLATATDAEVAAREAALTLAGAFANEGFKMRDGHWSGSLGPGEKKVLEVNLYAGNQYWFSLAASAESKGVKVTVFDETGAQANSESYADGVTAAAGLQPSASGPYFVQIELVSGEPGAFCLVYSYK